MSSENDHGAADPYCEAMTELVMKLADRYAHVYSFVGDDTMPKARADLLAAVRSIATGPKTATVQPLSDFSTWACPDHPESPEYVFTRVNKEKNHEA